MSTQHNNGGPAFPLVAENGLGHIADGMSLRDYFAIHCDQPGEAEIVTAAGLVLRNHAVWADEQTKIGSFTEWYAALGQDRRFALYSKVRYALADAMLAERSKAEAR